MNFDKIHQIAILDAYAVVCQLKNLYNSKLSNNFKLKSALNIPKNDMNTA